MTAKTAIIGYTGFVGGNLLQAHADAACFRSTNIDEIRGNEYEHVICAGVQAMKWWANLHPAEDMAGIERLLSALSEVKAERFTLISSIDVYPAPRLVDENSTIDREGHHAYGLNRLHVEDWVREHFDKVAVLRLPGLFGPGLKKNVIFDMLNDNDLQKVHPEGSFQYYDLRHVAADVDKAWDEGITLLNLSSGPLLTREIRDAFFPGKVLGGQGPAPASYDFRSIHAEKWGNSDGYLYSKAQVLNDLSTWLQEERSR